MTKSLLALLLVLGVTAPAFAIMPQVPQEQPAPTPAAGAADARKACTDAMNADPMFATAIVETADKVAAERRLALDQQQHAVAAAAVSKNQRHVVMAYIAMWLLAVGFVVFLWRRQQLLRTEIAALRRDVEAAAKDEA